jgi:hypothetical protein
MAGIGATKARHGDAMTMWEFYVVAAKAISIDWLKSLNNQRTPSIRASEVGIAFHSHGSLWYLLTSTT